MEVAYKFVEEDCNGDWHAWKLCTFSTSYKRYRYSIAVSYMNASQWRPSDNKATETLATAGYTGMSGS